MIKDVSASDPDGLAHVRSTLYISSFSLRISITVCSF
jgi:hypothetical protein